MGKIKTSKVAAFINTGSTSTPVWTRIRKQSELSIKYNANTSEDKWIDEDGPSTNVDNYNVTIDNELVCYDDDSLFGYLDDKRINRLTDANCNTEVMIVYMYAGTVADTYKAEKSKCSISFGDYGGEGGGGNISLSYTVTMNGDAEIGTAKVTETNGNTTIVFTKTGTSGTASVDSGSITPDTEE